jgi:hypothetical protein
MKTATATATAVLVAALAATASQASASEIRRFSYVATNDEAQHRTQDIALTVEQGLFGGMRVLHLYRSRGEDFDLKVNFPAWRPSALKAALQGDPNGVHIYLIDPATGEGFARGACHGARKAWLAMVAPHPYEPLVIAVLADNPAAHAPVVCERLEYRWQGEWVLPGGRNDSRNDPGQARTKF